MRVQEPNKHLVDVCGGSSTFVFSCVCFLDCDDFGYSVANINCKLAQYFTGEKSAQSRCAKKQVRVGQNPEEEDCVTYNRTHKSLVGKVAY